MSTNHTVDVPPRFLTSTSCRTSVTAPSNVCWKAAGVATTSRRNKACLALWAITLLMACAAVFAFSPLLHPASAYADMTAGQIAVQNEGEGKTKLTTDMFSLMDSNLTTEALPTVKFGEGENATDLAENDFSLTVTGIANAEAGRTVVIAAKDTSETYRGAVKFWYKASDENTSGTDLRIDAGAVEVAYSKSKGFTVSPIQVEQLVEGTNYTIDKSTESMIKLLGKGDDLSGQNVTVQYSIVAEGIITKNMVQLVPGEDDANPIQVTITDGTVPLSPDGDNKDYTATVTTNDPIQNVYKVTITGQNAYADTQAFDIYCVLEGEGAQKTVREVKPLTEATTTITLSPETFVYQTDAEGNAIEQRPTVTVRYNGAALTGKTAETATYDYEITWPADVTTVGEKTITITGAGNYYGALTATYSIQQQRGDFYIELSGDAFVDNAFTYNGASQKPTVTVKKKVEGGEPVDLPESSYTISFPADTTNVGQKSVSITGVDGTVCAGWIAIENYTIVPIDLSTTKSAITVALEGETDGALSLGFTGDPLTPAVKSVTLALNDAEGKPIKDASDQQIILALGESDYTVSYSNNVNAAKSDNAAPPTVSITGAGGNFIGTYGGKKFTINAMALSDALLTISAVPDKTYTGSAITPVPASVKVGDRELVYNVDYYTYFTYDHISVSNSNYGYIYGMGNYSGGGTAFEFKIVGRQISGASVAAVGNQTYTGYSVTPRPTVTYGGKTLTQGTDYTLSYANNIIPGTATITIAGKTSAGFDGTKQVTFKINETGTSPKVNAIRAGDGRVLLYWNPIYRATKYAVYEKMPNGSYTLLDDNCLYTYGSVRNLSTTRAHRFIVRAFVNGSWSSNSDSLLVSITPSGPSKPTVRALSASNTSVNLSWNDVPGADRYAIYEKVGKKFMARTTSYTATTATLTQLKKKQKYTFYVRAHVDGKWSPVTKADYVKISPSDPNPPTVTAVGGVGPGKVQLSWNKVRGAKKYWAQVQLPNGKWKTLSKKLKKKQRSYIVSGLTPGVTYTFRVRAYANKKWSKNYPDYYVTASPDSI